MASYGFQLPKRQIQARFHLCYNTKSCCKRNLGMHSCFEVQTRSQMYVRICLLYFTFESDVRKMWVEHTEYLYDSAGCECFGCELQGLITTFLATEIYICLEWCNATQVQASFDLHWRVCGIPKLIWSVMVRLVQLSELLPAFSTPLRCCSHALRMKPQSKKRSKKSVHAVKAW